MVVDGEAYSNCNTGCGGLISVDPATGAESELSANTMSINSGSQLFNGPFALAIDSSGEIIVISTAGMGGSCSGGCGGVLEVNANTGQESFVSSNAMPINASSQYFNQPTGVTIDRAGNILVTDWGDCPGCGKVIEVDPATGKQTLLASNAMPINASSRLFDYIQGVALDHDGNMLVANASTHGTAGNIVEVNPTTGKQTELSGNDMPVNASSQYLWAPVNMAVDAAGDVLVADWGHHPSGSGDVIKIDPATGKETLLSANSLPVNATSQYLDGPTGIALDAHGNIIVADESAFGPCTSSSCGGVIEVDSTTGKETKLSANDMPVNGSYPLFVQPFDVAVVPGDPTPPPGGGPGGSPRPTTVRRPGSSGHGALAAPLGHVCLYLRGRDWRDRVPLPSGSPADHHVPLTGDLRAARPGPTLVLRVRGSRANSGAHGPSAVWRFRIQGSTPTRPCRPQALSVIRRGPSWKPSATSAADIGEPSDGWPSIFSSASRLILPARTCSTIATSACSTRGSSAATSVCSPRPPRSRYTIGSPSSSTTYAPATR